MLGRNQEQLRVVENDKLPHNAEDFCAITPDFCKRELRSPSESSPSGTTFSPNRAHAFLGQKGPSRKGSAAALAKSISSWSNGDRRCPIVEGLTHVPYMPLRPLQPAAREAQKAGSIPQTNHFSDRLAEVNHGCFLGGQVGAALAPPPLGLADVHLLEPCNDWPHSHHASHQALEDQSACFAESAAAKRHSEMEVSKGDKMSGVFRAEMTKKSSPQLWPNEFLEPPQGFGAFRTFSKTGSTLEAKPAGDPKGQHRPSCRVPPWKRPFVNRESCGVALPKKAEPFQAAVSRVGDSFVARGTGVSRQASAADLLRPKEPASRGPHRECSWPHPVQERGLLHAAAAARGQQKLSGVPHACWSVLTTQSFSACAAGAARAAADAAPGLAAAATTRRVISPELADVATDAESAPKAATANKPTASSQASLNAPDSPPHKNAVANPTPGGVQTENVFDSQETPGKAIPLACASEAGKPCTSLTDAKAAVTATANGAPAETLAAAAAASKTAGSEYGDLECADAAVEGRADKLPLLASPTRAEALKIAATKTPRLAAPHAEAKFSVKGPHSLCAPTSRRQSSLECVPVLCPPRTGSNDLPRTPDAGTNYSSSITCKSAGRPPRKPWKIFDEQRPLRLKVVTFGPAGCGKSCLVRRFCERRFVGASLGCQGEPSRAFNARTIASDFGVRDVSLETGESVRLHFIDLSGAPIFADAKEGVFLGADVLICVFEAARPETLQEALEQLHAAKEATGVYTRHNVLA